MSIKQAIEALEVAQEALDISQSLQESAKSNHHLKTLAAYGRVSAALAALRSMPQGEPVKQGNADEKESGTWPVNPHSQEDGGHDASGTCTQGRTGEVQCDKHRAGNADVERENDQRAGRGDGVRGACDVSPPQPYGQVTTHSVTGQQFFFRWPEPPYLDNASECVTVYATPPTEAVRMSEAEINSIYDETPSAKPGPFIIRFARAVEQATAARLGVKMGDV